MKSFSAMLYVDPAVRSTVVDVHVPSAFATTAELARLRAGAAMSYVKQRPDTCGKRPSTAGIRETPFSSIVFSSAPFTPRVATMVPNGSTASDCPRVIGNGGGAYDGQKSPARSGFGHVRSALRPPEFVT